MKNERGIEVLCNTTYGIKASGGGVIFDMEPMRINWWIILSVVVAFSFVQMFLPLFFKILILVALLVFL